MLFALLSIPQDKSVAEQRIAKFFGISVTQASNLLSPFLKKDSFLAGGYGKVISHFPESIVREYRDNECHKLKNGKNNSEIPIYSPAEFKFSEVDIDTRRMLRCPHGLVLIVTTNCATNCIYCYADKNTRCKTHLDIKEIERILKEAWNLGIRELQMIGGEFFLHPNWYEILSTATKLGFRVPLISTKLPLTYEQMLKFKEFNIRLQISLDTLCADMLKNTLCVSESYGEKIIKVIEYADKLKLRYKISTVLTRQTATVENLSNLYKKFRNLRSLQLWSVRLAFPSLYTSHPFEEIKVTEDQFMELQAWYEEIKSTDGLFPIDFPESFKTRYQYASKGSQCFDGARCSANMSHMVVLPDGNVTICEQLYWNPRFIIGNVLKDSIDTIWNSPKALSLSRLPQKDLNPESACSSCAIYDSCRDFSNKCFANTIKAYGNEHWDYPDPRCAYAPAFLNEII
ncbi:MAG: radical SAM protein [Muribaculaceae bacterium]|nr:radical SAM protein [Muribaculaceae bacterium]